MKMLQFQTMILVCTLNVDRMITHRELLQRRLQFFVISSGGSVYDLLLPPGGSLTTNTNLGLELFKLFLIHCV